MGQTQRFGLNYFGGTEVGSVEDDGGKFTGRDRQVLDRILAALEAHDHVGGTRLVDPAAPPTAVLATSGGQLEAGRTYYYRTSYIDEYGLETAASGEVSVVAPAPLATPAAPGVQTVSGGTLGTGLHWYALTAISADGLETQISAPAVITISDWKTVQVSWVAPDGAANIGVWRQAPLDGGYTKIATVAAANGTFLDDGSIPSSDCPCDPENLPPDTNLTNATNKVTITLPAGALDTGLQRWRIYRTTESGVYPDASLVAEVSETSVELGGQLVTTYDDTGLALGYGQPLETSQTLQPSTRVGGGAGGVLILRSPSGTNWRVTCATDGSLVTRASDVTGASVILITADGTEWLLSVTDAGALQTSVDTAGVGQRFAFDAGPLLPTPDPTIDWMLRITVDGALQTVLA